MHTRTYLFTFFVLFFFTAACLAQENNNTVKLNGFLTASFTQSDNDTDTPYLNSLATDELSLDTYENRLGIQISATVADNMSVTSQLIARGGSDNYQTNIDWAYLDVQAGSNFNIQAGKYKIPLFIVSDYAEVGYAYPWARPPQDVYYINPLTSQSGLKLFYNIPMNGISILTQAYYGEGNHEVFVPARSLDINNVPLAKDQKISLKTKQAAGANLTIQGKHLSFRIAYFDTKVDAPDMGIENASGNFSSAGLTLDWKNILLFSEYANRDTDTNKIRAFPDQEAWYITLGYRIKSYLPYMTYSEIGEGNDPSELSIEQTSTALGLRFELNKGAAIKLEALQSVPEKGNHGLFDAPVDKGMVYSLLMDAVF